MVFNWVTQMVDYCELIPRLVPDCQSYAKVIEQTPEIVELIDKIRGVMDDNHHSCQLLQDNFMRWAIFSILTSSLLYCKLSILQLLGRENLFLLLCRTAISALSITLAIFHAATSPDKFSAGILGVVQ